MYEHIRAVEADHWWYQGRRAIVFGWAEDALAGLTAPRVLDVGCGTGYNLGALRQRGNARAVGLDFAPEALRFCRERGLDRLVCADGARLPFRPGSFDVVMALDMIEHLRDDGAALAGFADVLAPGGHLVLFVPAFRFLWSWQDEVSHHFRRYTRRELQEKVVAAGFEIRKLSYANSLLFPVVWGGRLVLKLLGRQRGTSENDLHPGWSNGVLGRVFGAEAGILRCIDFPIGVSLLCIARRPKVAARPEPRERAPL
jgi:SAM-dependent methyltransferase